MDVAEVLKTLGITTETVIDALAQQLRDEFDGSVGELFRSEVAKIAQKAAPAIVEAHLNLAVDNIINGTYQPINEWGEPKGKPTSLREMVQHRCIKYLEEKVDSDGKSASYQANTPRAEWLAREAAKKAVDYQAKEHLTKACEQAKAEIKTLVAQHITQMLLK